MSDSLSFAPRSPLAAVGPAAPASAAVAVSAAVPVPAPGVTAAVLDGFGLATVLARRGASQALAERARERFGMDLPTGPTRSAASGVAFAGTGPGAWLAMAERGGNEFAARLMSDLHGVASVSDQSDGYVLIRLTGARVRDALSKLVPIDLHPRAFKAGDVASTVASHIGVTLWRPADGPDAAHVFEVAMFRSLARSFWHALADAAAEYGFAAHLP
jgi:methylglutamate dehydrogenase subunit D